MEQYSCYIVIVPPCGVGTVFERRACFFRDGARKKWPLKGSKHADNLYRFQVSGVRFQYLTLPFPDTRHPNLNYLTTYCQIKGLNKARGALYEPTIGSKRYHRFIVDDDASVRRALKRFIKVSEFKAKTFGSAREFIDSGHYQSTGVLVLDVRMPGMSGLELQEHLCELGHTMPVIFITAFGELQAAVLAMKRGAIDFIEKPYDSEQLLAQIQKALRDHAQRAGIEVRIALLTRREKQVLDLVSMGKSSCSIAEHLCISQKTIEAHRTSIMKKMQVRSVSELISVYLHTIRHGSVLNN
jgi:FixJ family two-component response regulator